jgi:hypothetical protein
MGIICEKCGIVYLISAASNNRIDFVPGAGSEMFTLTRATCKIKRSFHKSDLTPYVVSTRGSAKGYAERGEYRARQELANVALHKAGPRCNSPYLLFV